MDAKELVNELKVILQKIKACEAKADDRSSERIQGGTEWACDAKFYQGQASGYQNSARYIEELLQSFVQTSEYAEDYQKVASAGVPMAEPVEARSIKGSLKK